MANLFPRGASVWTEGVDVDNHRLTDSWSNNKTFRVISLRADLRF
jgi:iron complex outermembrane receptor protein